MQSARRFRVHRTRCWPCTSGYPAELNKLQEADLLPGIAALPDFIGVTAYVPLSDANAPSYQDMYENLTGPSRVDSVRSLVSEKAAEWRRPEVRVTWDTCATSPASGTS